MEAETTITISPFIFVDGRKYILADPEELPEPEIFSRITPPPRNISPLVLWRLFLCRESELLLIATFIGMCCGCGLGWLFIDGFAFVGFIIMGTILPMFLFVLNAVMRILLAARKRLNIIHLLQNGLIGKGCFVGMASTGNREDNLPEIELKYQFTSEDGNTRSAFHCVTDMRKLMELSSASQKLILYDSIGPSRNLLFDTLPKGIDFDEATQTFYTSLSFLVVQIFGLCLAVSIVPAIIFGIYVLLC